METEPLSEILKSPLQTIREHCLECQGWNDQSAKPVKAVRECQNKGCRFHFWRLGKNPNRKGKGGNPRLNADLILETIRDML